MTDQTAPWQVEFYERNAGERPVEDFLVGLDKASRAKVLALIQLLAEHGPTLPFPYSSQVRGKIRELRMGAVARLHQAHTEDTRAGHKDRGGQDDGIPRAAEKGGAMKRPTNWDLYFRKQLGDPEMRGLIEDEIESLRVGIQIAKMRQKRHLSQAQLAARAGMSAPNISRIENSPAQNMTLETLVRIARALGHGVDVTFRARRPS